MTAPATITRTTWTDAPPDGSATTINNAALQAIYDKVDDLVTRHMTVSKAGTLVGRRGVLNLIEGSNVTLTVTDDSGNGEVDVTIAAASQLESYDVQFSTAAIALDAVASTTVLSQTETGILSSIGISVQNSIGSSGSATLDITIDGGTKRSLTLYSSDTSWVSTAQPLIRIGNGAAAGDVMYMNIGTRYVTSVLVAVDVTNAFASLDKLDVVVIRGVAL